MMSALEGFHYTPTRIYIYAQYGESFGDVVAFKKASSKTIATVQYSPK